VLGGSGRAGFSSPLVKLGTRRVPEFCLLQIAVHVLDAGTDLLDSLDLDSHLRCHLVADLRGTPEAIPLLRRQVFKTS
jgi:hypothetical protein